MIVLVDFSSDCVKSSNVILSNTRSMENWIIRHNDLTEQSSEFVQKRVVPENSPQKSLSNSEPPKTFNISFTGIADAGLARM